MLECARLKTENAQWKAERDAYQQEMAAMVQKHARQIAELQGAKLKSAAVPATSARVWTDASGQHRVEAVLVKLEDGKVFLRRRDGRVVVLPLEKLSSEDQKYVRRRSDSR